MMPLFPENQLPHEMGNSTMKLSLAKKPKGVTIIEAFPGLGMIGTITTEYLLQHLQSEQIGSIELSDVPAMIAIHADRIIEPVSIHYCKKYNLVIVHSINPMKSQCWRMADLFKDLARELDAKEIICIEGVGSAAPIAKEVYFYSTGKDQQKVLSNIATPLHEGIIVGVTGALLVKEKDIPITALFAETISNMPDSKAAADVIERLDKYLGLRVDYGPLLKQAEMFEKKLKGFVKKSMATDNLQKKKELSYVG